MDNTPNGSDFDKRSMMGSLPVLSLGKKDKQRSDQKKTEDTLLPLSIKFEYAVDQEK